MRVGLFDPYLTILGGAERYIASIAACLKDAAEIVLFNGDNALCAQIKEKFQIDLTPLNVKFSPWPSQRSARIAYLKTLDVFFYITDGSIFFARARKNFLIIQSPAHIPQKSFINRLKLRSWHIIVYSQFMADIVYERLGIRATVLFVPISNAQQKPVSKENLILSVGRFFENLHSKKQLEMVETFKALCDGGLKGVQLVLIGSVDPGAQAYHDRVVQAAQGYPILIETKMKYDELAQYYQKAKIYWHAAGFGEDLHNFPERAEHFGVSTVEAMKFGAVPIVYNGGGQKEIVHNGQNGFTWESRDALKELTVQVLRDAPLFSKLSTEAIKTSSNYTMDLFCEKLHSLL